MKNLLVKDPAWGAGNPLAFPSFPKRWGGYALIKGSSVSNIQQLTFSASTEKVDT